LETSVEEIGSTPYESVPAVILEALRLGISAATKLRKVGVAAPPEVGPAKMVLALWVSKVAPNVPVVVTGEPVTEKISLGMERPTEVTVPSPLAPTWAST